MHGYVFILPKKTEKAQNLDFDNFAIFAARNSKGASLCDPNRLLFLHCLGWEALEGEGHGLAIADEGDLGGLNRDGGDELLIEILGVAHGILVDGNDDVVGVNHRGAEAVRVDFRDQCTSVATAGLDGGKGTNEDAIFADDFHRLTGLGDVPTATLQLVGNVFGDGGLEFEDFARAPDFDGDFLAGWGALHQADQLIGCLDFAAVVFHDDIAGLQSGGFCRRTFDDVDDEAAMIFGVTVGLANPRIERMHVDAEEAMHGTAFFEDLLERFTDIVGGDGEADTLETGIFFVGRKNGYVNADDFTLEVDQGSSRVARIDGSIGLEKIALLVGNGAFFGGDDALGHRLAQSEGIAYGEDDLSDFDLRGIAELERCEGSGSFNFQYGEIEHAVLANEDGGVGFAIVQGDLDLSLAGDHVLIGDDVAFVGDDHAGALTLGHFSADARAAPGIAQELLAHACGIDADNRWNHRLGEFCVFVIESG